MTASKKPTSIRFKRDPASSPKLSPEQAVRLDALPIDYSDIPELPDNFWARPSKESVTMRLDRDVLEFFRASGSRGYQTRINAVLRAFVEQNRNSRPSKPSAKAASHEKA